MVFGGQVIVVLAGGWVVVGRNVEGNGFEGLSAVAITGDVGEGVGAVVIGLGDVGERAVGVEGDGSVAGIAAENDGKRIVVGIVVVVQNAANRVDRERRVFGEVVNVGGCCWGGVA